MSLNHLRGFRPERDSKSAEDDEITWKCRNQYCEKWINALFSWKIPSHHINMITLTTTAGFEQSDTWFNMVGSYSTHGRLIVLTRCCLIPYVKEWAGKAKRTVRETIKIFLWKSHRSWGGKNRKKTLLLHKTFFGVILQNTLLNCNLCNLNYPFYFSVAHWNVLCSFLSSKFPMIDEITQISRHGARCIIWEDYARWSEGKIYFLLFILQDCFGISI